MTSAAHRVKAFSTDLFVLPLPPHHRFPMEKYRLLRQRLEGNERIALCEPPAATDGELALAHAPAYVEQIVSGSLSEQAIAAIGFPWSEAMVERSRRSTGATIAAARAALEGPVGLAFNLAGGTHHAANDRGGGFCCFNDAAVAARLMQAQGLAPRVLIVDLDVHQGDGTARIFEHDPTVFTLSVHGAANYPFEKALSKLDCPLPDGTVDACYLETLSDALAVADGWHLPDLLIYLAGADPLAQDRLGRLDLTADGLARRDRMVFDWARSRRVPVAVAMAGGYARPIDLTVEVHLKTIEVGLEVFFQSQP